MEKLTCMVDAIAEASNVRSRRSFSRNQTVCSRPAPARSHEPDVARICRKLGVGRGERQTFCQGLGDQQAVEGVLVKVRKHVDGKRMVAGDREFDIAVSTIPRRRSRGSIRKSGRPRAPLMTTSQTLAGEKVGSLRGSSINARVADDRRSGV